ncbi:hypothetical protein MRX96_042863 [Rhipicephalus microplus]
MCADNTPSSSAGQRSSAHVPREPSPAFDEAESPTCADDAQCSSTSQCSSDHVTREPSPTLEEAQFSDEVEDPDSTASDDGRSPPHNSEGEILATAFGKLSSEKHPNLGTSKAGAAAMAMSFAISHGLTWTALGDLAKLTVTEVRDGEKATAA